MTHHWIVPLLAAILNAALGVIVVRHNPRNGLNRLYGLLSIALVFWNLNIFVLYAVSDAEAAKFWSDLFRVGTLMASPLVAHMLVVFNGTRSRWFWGAIAASYALSLFLVAANATGNLVSSLQTYPWGFYPVGGTLYKLLPVSVGFNLALILIALFRVIATSESPRQRQQAKLWLVGVAIAMPFGVTNVIATFGIPFYPLGNMANVVYTAFVAYGIVRHRLMDIDLVISKGGAYSLVTLLVIVPAFALSIWMQEQAFGRIDADFSTAILVLFVLVAVLFPVLRSRTELRIERSFFREKHQYRAALSAFTRSIVRILERDKLIRELGNTLSETLQVDRVAIALADEAKRTISVRFELGVPASTSEFPESHDFIRAMARHSDPVLADEIGAGTDRIDRLAAELFRRNGWEVCIPLNAGGRLIGFIGLGCKRNLDVFFTEDLALLGMLAAEASVALENARLYEELKKSQDIIRRADRLSALGTLAAGIAHEIRNPLVSIQTFFQLAPQRLNDHEFMTEFLRLTSGEVKRITDLISELLSFAKSPTHAMAEVDLNGLLENVTKLVEPQIRKSAITVRRDFAAGLPAVWADRDQLKQVFLNVLLNAVQAIDRTGEVCIASREITHGGERFCQVEITDTGGGIPPDLIDHIFNPFFTTKQKGTGLGLSIAHQVVTEHGGFMTVQSEVGKGSTFAVHLRLAAGRTKPAREEEPRRAAGGSRARYW